MFTNKNSKGIAALWLIIAGFILIAGSGYFFIKSSWLCEVTGESMGDHAGSIPIGRTQRFCLAKFLANLE